MIIKGNKDFISGQFMRAQIVIDGLKVREILPYDTKRADVLFGKSYAVAFV